MGNKNHLTLYINNDLVTLAKTTGLNLSQEFEEWIKIRLNQNNETTNDSNPDQEIIRLQAEIQKLKSKKELQKEQDDKDKEEIMVVDNMINNMVEFKESLDNPSDSRCHGLQFLFQKRFHKVINPLKAKEILLNRIKERELIA